MTRNLLVLGGTTEATALCHALAAAQIPTTVSLAGRVARPKPLPCPVRIGGFGGIEGLRDYLRKHAITHVVDATHPFAAQMSRNAARACDTESVPLIALTRAPWRAQTGDHWSRVPDMEGAVAALDRPAERVFLAVGRMHVNDFAAQPHHHYLLRLVDRPDGPLPLPHHVVEVARGPFDLNGDLALMRQHKITLVVSKNSGGSGARAKIDAARVLGLPVILIDRPPLPARQETHDVTEVLDWLGHAGGTFGTNRGV